MHRLITIRFSHYNEKARWAMDRFRIPCRESPWMPLLTRALVVTPTASQRSLEKLRGVLDEIEPRLDGRRFVVGDRSSAADIAFACMLAPAILPTPREGFGGYLPSLEQVPEPAATLARELRDRPAGRFAMRLFAEERGERRVPCRPWLDPAMGSR